uniref:Mitogen-activated protein kinase 8 interacting protein 1 n=1 Tax=Petromyzon marinus TaxID=7757 RepID=S4RPL6_PETMA
LSPRNSGEMAEHHHLHLSSPESSPFLGLQLTSPSGFSRLSNDISLEEFEDEDFSEIVDDCGITAPCLSDLTGSFRQPHAPILNLKQQVVGSLVEHLQEDLLELELIDAEDDEFETEVLGQSSAKTSIHGVCHHVPQGRQGDWRTPSRLNFPFVDIPYHKDTLNNNNNCGPKKSTWQDKVRSSSPLRNGFHSPSHLCLKEQQQQQAAMAGDRQASSNLNSSSNHNGPAMAKYSGTGMGAPGPHGKTRRGWLSPACWLRSEGMNPTERPKRPETLPLGRTRRTTMRRKLLPVQGDGCKEAKSPGATLPESKATETRGEPCALRQMAAAGGGRRPTRCSDSSALSYESVRYMLVMDEHTKLEMSALSPPRIASGLAEEDGGGGGKRGGGTPVPPDVASPRDAEAFRRHEAACFSDTTCSSPESEFPFSKKFLNVFMNGATRSSSTESFGLFSCVIDGEEREQTHRAVFRFVPRHPDEVPMDVDDPLYVERQADDFWCEGYNMRTGEHGVFPAYYAHAVSQDPEDVYGKSRNDDWVERFGLHFLGSVEVPYHKGNNVLCAAMQKIAQARRVTVHLKPPSVCTLEITAQGIRLVLKAGSYQHPKGGKCSHFFKLRNVSFCGYHPKKSNYFGFITKHPSDHRFACHVFVAEDSTRPVAESVGKAFQVFYKEYLEYACPTEDIYLE